MNHLTDSSDGADDAEGTVPATRAGRWDVHHLMSVHDAYFGNVQLFAGRCVAAARYAVVALVPNDTPLEQPQTTLQDVFVDADIACNIAQLMPSSEEAVALPQGYHSFLQDLAPAFFALKDGALDNDQSNRAAALAALKCLPALFAQQGAADVPHVVATDVRPHAARPNALVVAVSAVPVPSDFRSDFGAQFASARVPAKHVAPVLTRQQDLAVAQTTTSSTREAPRAVDRRDQSVVALEAHRERRSLSPPTPTLQPLVNAAAAPLQRATQQAHLDRTRRYEVTVASEPSTIAVGAEGGARSSPRVLTKVVKAGSNVAPPRRQSPSQTANGRSAAKSPAAGRSTTPQRTVVAAKGAKAPRNVVDRQEPVKRTATPLRPDSRLLAPTAATIGHRATHQQQQPPATADAERPTRALPSPRLLRPSNRPDTLGAAAFAERSNVASVVVPATPQEDLWRPSYAPARTSRAAWDAAYL